MYYSSKNISNPYIACIITQRFIVLANELRREIQENIFGMVSGIYIYIRYSSYIKYIIYILHLFIYITLDFIEFPFSDHNPILIYYVYTDVLYHHLSVLVLVLVLTSVRHGNFSKKMS